MLSHNRPGLTRPKIVIVIVVSTLLLLIAAFAVYTWSFTKLMREGAVDTLESLNFYDQFSSDQKAAGTAANTTADVETKDNPTMGSEEAPLRVVEFVDFSCPYSKEESSVIRTLATTNPGKIRLQVRDFPLDDLHPTARLAAEAAACAAEQGKYWAMYDALFANQSGDGVFTPIDLRRYALGTGLEAAKYDACLKTNAASAKIQADYDAGVAAGVTGTPTFFVNGYKIDGAIPADTWQTILKLAK